MEQNNYYVRITIITPAGQSTGEAGPFSKEVAERKAAEETYSEGRVRQYAVVVQH